MPPPPVMRGWRIAVAIVLSSPNLCNEPGENLGNRDRFPARRCVIKPGSALPIHDVRFVCSRGGTKSQTLLRDLLKSFQAIRMQN